MKRLLVLVSLAIALIVLVFPAQGGAMTDRQQTKAIKALKKQNAKQARQIKNLKEDIAFVFVYADCFGALNYNRQNITADQLNSEANLSEVYFTDLDFSTESCDLLAAKASKSRLADSAAKRTVLLAAKARTIR